MPEEWSGDGAHAHLERADTAPLGPWSLLWRYAGDWRAMLPGSATGILQLLHPGIGAGVAEHSEFFADPFGRIRRSIPQIWATIYAPDADVRGRGIRDLHATIRGTDDAGRRYHALDPETFWWAHATFTWNVLRSVELFHRRALRGAELEQLYSETVTWYSRYGVSMRPVPADYGAFRARFESICEATLELTPAASVALGYRLADVPGQPLGPGPLRSVLTPLLAPAAELLVAGCLPRTVRERFAVSYGAAERAQFRGIAAAVRQGFRLVPHPLNQRSFREAQRRIGAATRHRRYRPAA